MHSHASGTKLLISGVFFLLLFSFSTPLASAATKKKVPDPIQAETVNLYCTFKSGNKTISSSGSGVFIGDRGVILTNAHVAQYFVLLAADTKFKGDCSVRTGSPAKAAYTASVLYISSNWMTKNAEKIAKNTTTGTGEHDFALLYITGAEKGSALTTFPTALLGSDAIAEDAGVSVAGYPTEKLNYKKVQKNLAQVQASSTITNVQTFKPGRTQDLITIAPSAAGSFGVSGGPVFDENNALIGIVSTKAAAKNDRTLRAITLPYIDASLKSELGLSLEDLIASNFSSRAAITAMSVPQDFIDALSKSFRKKK